MVALFTNILFDSSRAARVRRSGGRNLQLDRCCQFLVLNVWTQWPDRWIRFLLRYLISALWIDFPWAKQSVSRFIKIEICIILLKLHVSLIIYTYVGSYEIYLTTLIFPVPKLFVFRPIFIQNLYRCSCSRSSLYSEMNDRLNSSISSVISFLQDLTPPTLTLLILLSSRSRLSLSRAFQ